MGRRLGLGCSSDPASLWRNLMERKKRDTIRLIADGKARSSDAELVEAYRWTVVLSLRSEVAVL